MYVGIFPCDQESKAVFYPIVPGDARPLGRTLLVDVKLEEPQPEFVGYQLCAQVVADGMSFKHYASNVVRARRAERPESR